MNQNVLPLPGSLWTPISPPINSASCLEIASPRPVPPYLRVVDVSACSNAWNSRSLCSSVMPMPVSLTAKSRACSRPCLPGRELDDDLALFGELDGIVAEVDQDLPKPQRIAAAMGGDRGLDVEDQFQPLGRGLLGDQVADVVEHLFEIEIDLLDRQLAGFDLREVENVVDDAEEMLAGALIFCM